MIRNKKKVVDDAYRAEFLTAVEVRAIRKRRKPVSLIAPLERMHNRKLPADVRDLIVLHERFELRHGNKCGIGFWDLLPTSDLVIPEGEGNLFEALVLRDQNDFNNNVALMQYAAALIPVGIVDAGDLLFISLEEEDDSTPIAYWSHEGAGELVGVVADSLPTLGYAALLDERLRQAEGTKSTLSAVRADAQAIKGRFQFKWVTTTADYGIADVQIVSSCKSSSEVALTHRRAMPLAYALSPYLVSRRDELDDDAFWSPLEDTWDAYPHDEETFNDGKDIIQAIQTYPFSAFYWLFRPFFLKEKQTLDRTLRHCSKSKAPLIRDMARLVQELVDGRPAVGKVKDIRRIAERVREVARR